MLLFYTPDIHDSHQQFVLSEEESKHAVRVLRLGVGEEIYIVNGIGDLFRAKIIDAHPKRTTLDIVDVQKEYQRPSYHLHVAVAPTKSMDRLEWFLEKATEVGIQEVTPLICEHSERKEVKVERLNKVVIAAMKQSLKAYLPQINEPVAFSKFLQQQDGGGVSKCIAHCVDAEKKYLSTLCQPNGKYLILVGPEGDFSATEIQQALDAGFEPISLGNARLRTETAALAATLEIALLNR